MDHETRSYINSWLSDVENNSFSDKEWSDNEKCTSENSEVRSLTPSSSKIQRSDARDLDEGMFGPIMPPSKQVSSKRPNLIGTMKSKWDDSDDSIDGHLEGEPLVTMETDRKVISGVLGVEKLIKAHKGKHRHKRKKAVSKKKQHKKNRDYSAERSSSPYYSEVSPRYHLKRSSVKKRKSAKKYSDSPIERERKRRRRSSSSSYHRRHESSSDYRSQSKSPKSIRNKNERKLEKISPVSLKKSTHISPDGLTPRKKSSDKSDLMNNTSKGETKASRGSGGGDVKKRSKGMKSLLSWQPPLDEEEEDIVVLKKHKDRTSCNLPGKNKNISTNPVLVDAAKQDRMAVLNNVKFPHPLLCEKVRTENTPELLKSPSGEVNSGPLKEELVNNDIIDEMLSSALDLSPEVKQRSKVNIRSRMLLLQMSQQTTSSEENEKFKLEVNNNQLRTDIISKEKSSQNCNNLNSKSLNSSGAESDVANPAEVSPENAQVDSISESGDSPKSTKDIGIWSDDDENDGLKKKIRLNGRKKKSSKIKLNNKPDLVKEEVKSVENLKLQKAVDLGVKDDIFKVKEVCPILPVGNSFSKSNFTVTKHELNSVEKNAPLKPTMISTLTPTTLTPTTLTPTQPAPTEQFRVTDPGGKTEDADEDLQLHEGLPTKKPFVFNIKLPKPEVAEVKSSKKKKKNHKKKAKKTETSSKSSPGLKVAPDPPSSQPSPAKSSSNPTSTVSNLPTPSPVGNPPPYPPAGNPHNMIYNPHYYPGMQMHPHYMRTMPYPYYNMMAYMAYTNRAHLHMNGRPMAPMEPPPLPEAQFKPPEPEFDPKKFSDHRMLSLFATKDITNESLQRIFDQTGNDVKLPSPASSPSVSPQRPRKRRHRRRSRGRRSSSWSSDSSSRSRSPSYRHSRSRGRSRRRRRSYSSSRSRSSSYSRSSSSNSRESRRSRSRSSYFSTSSDSSRYRRRHSRSTSASSSGSDIDRPCRHYRSSHARWRSSSRGSSGSSRRSSRSRSWSDDSYRSRSSSRYS